MLNNQFDAVITPPRVKEQEVLKCVKCHTEWFEQVRINQFLSNHQVIPGQTVPIGGPQEFILLRCIKCNEMYQPRMLITGQDALTKLYNKMLDQLEAK